MAKGKAKVSNNDSLASAQQRSLRSRKRECPSEEISETEDVLRMASLCHQDTEEKNTAMLLVQQPTVVLIDFNVFKDETDEQASACKQDLVTEEKHADASNGMVEVPEGKEKTTDMDTKNDSQPVGFGGHNNRDANTQGKIEGGITAEECNRLTSQASSDQPQAFLPTIDEHAGSSAVVFEEQPNEDSHCDAEINQETRKENPSREIMADVKVNTTEAAAGLPAKKKRRMGMCGLTEKERSHILQTQKRENGKIEPEREVVQKKNSGMDHEKIISSPSSSSSLSIPSDSVLKQNQAEKELPSSNCEDRADPEVHIAVTASDGTNTVCDPGCSQETLEAERGTTPDPEETTVPKSSLSAKENEKEKITDEENGSAKDKIPALTTCSKPTQNEETEARDATEASLLKGNSLTIERCERKEELIGDEKAGDGAKAVASSTESWSARSGSGSLDLCEAAETPSGSERKHSCDCDNKPDAGPDTVNAVRSKTPDCSDPFGSRGMDYVSDSQLNTIALSEEAMEEDIFGFPDCHEDSSDLICGLIRELSSLNRKVMATHRELENLRRNTKSSRSSSR